MPIMEAALRGDYHGQEIINRWNFIASGTPASVTLSFALAYAMGLVRSDVPPNYPTPGYYNTIAALQAPSFAYRELVTKDIFSVTDFYTNPYINGEVGLSSGEGQSPINAYGFRTNRVRADIARGTKRIAGVTEGATQEGGEFTTGAQGLMNAVASLMSDNIEYDDEGNTITFTPCIVGKEKYTTPSGKTAYRYYATETLQLAHIAQGISWEIYTTVRGQGSRQYGKGS